MCEICVYADEHGSWPPSHRGTHCRDSFDMAGVRVVQGCHRSWASAAQSHCAACHRHFGSNKAGDAHRSKGQCRDPKGFDRWETTSGVIFGGRDPEAARASLARVRDAGQGSVDERETPKPAADEVGGQNAT